MIVSKPTVISANNLFKTGLTAMLKREFSRIQAELIMVFVAFIWGATFVVVKNALADIGPFIFLGIRFLLAFLVLLAMTYGNMTQMRWATVKAGCLLGFFLLLVIFFRLWVCNIHHHPTPVLLRACR
jgi:drug/metabolite transporter (DMT)-like permease